MILAVFGVLLIVARIILAIIMLTIYSEVKPESPNEYQCMHAPQCYMSITLTIFNIGTTVFLLTYCLWRNSTIGGLVALIFSGVFMVCEIPTLILAVFLGIVHKLLF